MFSRLDYLVAANNEYSFRDELAGNAAVLKDCSLVYSFVTVRALHEAVFVALGTLESVELVGEVVAIQ